MLDPLRSLAELVRTLTRSRSGSRSEISGPRAPSPEKSPDNRAPPTMADPVESLRERLRGRLRVVGMGDRRRAREAFVETVLAAELGDAITLDPAMADIVSKIAQQLGNDASTERDLRLLLEELAH